MQENQVHDSLMNMLHDIIPDILWNTFDITSIYPNFMPDNFESYALGLLTYEIFWKNYIGKQLGMYVL